MTKISASSGSISSLNKRWKASSSLIKPISLNVMGPEPSKNNVAEENFVTDRIKQYLNSARKAHD